MLLSVKARPPGAASWPACCLIMYSMWDIFCLDVHVLVGKLALMLVSVTARSAHPHENSCNHHCPYPALPPHRCTAWLLCMLFLIELWVKFVLSLPPCEKSKL